MSSIAGEPNALEALPTSRRPAERAGRHLPLWVLAVVLGLLTWWVFAPSRGCEFIEFDDPDYVSRNEHVQQGLTWDSITWAFTTDKTSNWHPLTWLSLMLDYQLRGGDPYGFRLTNVWLHVANSVLVLLIFYRMTGDLARSGLLAVCFAVHPLRVESVAWISERKDVLSALFGLLSIGAYVSYARRGRWPWYLLVLVMMALSLTAKPTFVTLPCLLLLLDYWPLKRLVLEGQEANGDSGFVRRSLAWLLVEKLPLFGLAVGSCVITYLVQSKTGAAIFFDQLGVSSRLANALVAYASYIGKTFWFKNLTVLYLHPAIRHPGTLGWSELIVIPCAALLIAITILALWQLRRRPWLAVGWFWFLGALVPMIGLVQVGSQSMADRYSYLPSIGLLIMAFWSLPERLLDFKRESAARVVLAAAVCVVLVLFVFTRWQVGYWDNNIALFEHAVQVTDDNDLMYYRLGQALMAKHRVREAIRVYDAGLGINTNSALLNLGLQEAQDQLREYR